ncbi:MAG: addiction module protein [Chthoniobacteraceae bacterium]
MSPRLKQLEDEILRLPAEDREILADVLVNSLAAAPLNEIDQAWIEEAERRYDDWQNGRVTPIRGDEFFSKVREDLGWS